MNVYIAMVSDRHTEPEARVFSTSEKAIAFASSIIEENRASADKVDPKDAVGLNDIMRAAGWIFYACYSTEGDAVWVVKSELDRECETKI